MKSERLRNARDFTAWCLFNFDRYASEVVLLALLDADKSNSYLAWQFFRPPCLKEPPESTLPDPLLNPAWYSEIWTRYPLSQTPSPTYYGNVFRATCDFRVILSNLCHASFGKGPKLTSQQAMVFTKELIGWYKTLPIVLMPKYIVLPAHLLLQ